MKNCNKNNCECFDKEGFLLIPSNVPYGMIDSYILAALVNHRRTETKVKFKVDSKAYKGVIGSKGTA